MSEFRMPSLGADMEDGVLVEWLKQAGDPVSRGDIIAVVETQKGAIEIEIFEAGTIDRLLVEPGTRVPVGAPLAIVRGAGEAARPTPAAAPPPPKPAQPTAPKPISVPPVGRVKVSPAARKLAAARGVALDGVVGTGPGGAIVAADVERAAERPAGPAPRRGIDLGEMRKAIAAAMARSKREIPHYYLTHQIDVTATLAWLEAWNAGRAPPDRFLLAPLLLKAVALSLREFPELNGHHVENTFRPSAEIHIGTAIAIRGGGLVAPAIHDVDKKPLDALMAALRDLVARTRAGRLRSSELFDPTVTVSSLGDRGVDGLLGVIYPPQVALIGFGTPASRPWVVADRIEPRMALTISLAADHRASDGHRGALFLLAVARRLQQPGTL
jgi:pyruvate dehydrogenase E2 component (dihydrolipoamide acetyltransferase)